MSLDVHLEQNRLEHAGHARDFVRTITLADWSGIIAASGDGLVFEVAIRLFRRLNNLHDTVLPIDS